MAMKKIVSGGQTGTDRAALDWAIANNIPHGGWCPAGRKAEDGVIPTHYQLVEMPDGGGYRRRTKANVQDSDATLIISIEPELTGGSRETARFAERLAKPWLHVHPGQDWRQSLAAWLGSAPIQTLNVAGPRGGREPEVGSFVWQVLDEVKRFASAHRENAAQQKDPYALQQESIGITDHNKEPVRPSTWTPPSSYRAKQKI